MRRPATLVLLVACVLPPAQGDEAARAHYLGNAGVMVARGDTKVLFDPLFRRDYDIYERVPAAIEQAIFAGEAPFDGIDAVFISHSHEDHFDAALIVQLLEYYESMHLFAPAQAVAKLTAAGLEESARIHALAPAYDAAPIIVDVGELRVEAVRIPHSGWPDRWPDLQNIAFRTTLDGKTSVVHLGDADIDDAHFAKDAAHWAAHQPSLALPPFWFFLSPEGRSILSKRLGARQAIGVHVEKRVPDDPQERPAVFDGVDLFTRPGETRAIK